MSAGIRIVAGTLGGRRIDVPVRGTRPFAERVRESLFAILEPRLFGARVLDLCAGSGAAGFEALSRGAASVCFVERSREAAAVIERNARTLKCDGASSVRIADAATFVRATPSQHGSSPFDIVVFDPPYDDKALRQSVLTALAAPASLLAADGLVAASWRRTKGGAAEAPPVGLRLVRTLAYGATTIALLERDDGCAAPSGAGEEGT